VEHSKLEIAVFRSCRKAVKGGESDE